VSHPERSETQTKSTLPRNKKFTSILPRISPIARKTIRENSCNLWLKDLLLPFEQQHFPLWIYSQ